VHDVLALLERYAAVVAAHHLCPYEQSLGHTIVVLDRAFDSELVVCAIAATSARVVHVVFPCLPRDGSQAFERRCNDVATRVRERGSVHAAFHPAMTGGREDADRRVGLVRRTPDPLLQLVPVELPHVTARPIADLDVVLAELDALHAARRQLSELGAAA
jgi:hypothetical protein